MSLADDWKKYSQSIKVNLTSMTGLIYAVPANYGGYNATTAGPFHPSQGDPVPTLKAEYTKVWVHFARLFADRYTEWDLLPDSARPLNNSILRSKNRNITIESTLNGITVISSTTGAAARVADSLKRLNGSTSYRVDEHDFYSWALGSDDIPDFIVNP